MDGQTVREKGFFGGYTFWAWMTVINQAAGGLVVAMVVK
jgi:UDP-sugar transporter A1/2/3